MLLLMLLLLMMMMKMFVTQFVSPRKPTHLAGTDCLVYSLIRLHRSVSSDAPYQKSVGTVIGFVVSNLYDKSFVVATSGCEQI